MFKKALQVVTTFGLLMAGYFGYVQGFAMLVEHLVPEARRETLARGLRQPSRSETMSVELAVRGFGRPHWTTETELGYRYYHAEDGLWMYARDYKRLDDGKRLEFRPFAVVWESRDGKSLKTAISDSAVVELDQPLGLAVKPGSSSLRVLRASLEGHILLRDDKGTPSAADDLKITFNGPVPALVYDEKSQEIRTDSDVTIEDRDLRVTGQGLLITLRPKPAPPTPVKIEPGKVAPTPPPAGFNGAQTAILRKNVHIVIADVGQDGILPGNARPEQRQGARTPLEVRCDGMMQIDLPPPRLQPKVGPPAPQGPTIAQFVRNVEVTRGRPGEAPDKLDCDTLRLTLLPADPGQGPRKGAKANAVAAKAEPKSAEGDSPEGPLRELTLRKAVADGQNVWITSASQGVKARCNQLIHQKRMPEAEDVTYFLSNLNSRIIVEKLDVAQSGADRGRVTSHTTIRTRDATLLDNGQGNEAVTIVARGPGELETRPSPDKPVERSARWSDQLSLTDDPATAKKLGLPALKKVTLTGRPGFSDQPSHSELNAKDVLVVWLEPKARPANPQAAPNANGQGASGAPSFEINRLVALKDVRLTSPGKTLTARERLDAEFETSRTARPAAAPATAAPAPAPAPNPSPAPTTPPAQNPATPEKAEPDAQATANRVWALVRLRRGESAGSAPAAPAGTSGGAIAAPAGLAAEVGEVRLRGAVVFHQDPAPGKAKGVDVRGEAVDLSNQGEGALRLAIFHYDASADPPVKPTVKAASLAKAKGETLEGASPADRAPLARVETDELTIEGKVIGLDQSADQAWVDGKGSLTQLAAKGLLSDKGLANAPQADPNAKPGENANQVRPPAPDGAPVKRVPMTISWNQGMKFFGRSKSPDGRIVARAEFSKDVHAETEDAQLDCKTLMRTYLDRTITLSRRPGSTNSPNGEPKADISLIECIDNVVVVNTKHDPNGEIAQKQRIEGNYLIFKKAKGEFEVPGPGQVVLYDRDGQQANLLGPGMGRPAPANPAANNRSDRSLTRDRTIRLVADGPARTGQRPGNTPPPVIGHVPSPLDRVQAQGRGTRPNAAPANPRSGNATRPAGPAAAAAKPLLVTQVKFRKGMIGRFGSGKITDKNETRWADFFGDIEVVHGPVPDADTILDPDRLPRNAQFMTAQVLRVVSEPRIPKPGQPDIPPRSLLRAWENAVVTTDDKTITADTITYDSEKQLFYAYGEGGRPVVIAQQEQIGQGFSNVTGRAAMYNHKTGEAQLIEPNSLAIVDARTGARPRPVPAPSRDVKPQLPKRTPLRNPQGNLMERKSFRGQ